MTTTSVSTDDFRATATFVAAPDAVFSALTDIDSLTGWWTPAAGGAAAGDTLRFLFGDSELVVRVGEAEDDGGIPLAGGEVVAQFGRLGVEALCAE